MSVLAQSSTMSHGNLLHQSVDRLSEMSKSPLNLEKLREEFHDRAMRDITTSNADSLMMMDPNNPQLVKEEMDLQKDYFKKLKFTYLEQESKRNFLYSITGDEQGVLVPGENEQLEQENAQKKAALKSVKDEIDGMRVHTLRLAQSSAKQHAALAGPLAEAQALQKQIREMELELARINNIHPPDTRLTSDQAAQLLDDQIVEIERLTDENEMTKQSTEASDAEATRTAREIHKLSRERELTEARAKEVREGREAGDTKVDEICQWLSTSISFYKSMLGIHSVTARSNNNLEIVYDVPAQSGLSQSTRSKSDKVTVTLVFDEVTRKLKEASLIGSDINIEEAVTWAVSANDAPGLIADLLIRLRPPQ